MWNRMGIHRGAGRNILLTSILPDSLMKGRRGHEGPFPRAESLSGDSVWCRRWNAACPPVSFYSWTKRVVHRKDLSERTDSGRLVAE